MATVTVSLVSELSVGRFVFPELLGRLCSSCSNSKSLFQFSSTRHTKYTLGNWAPQMHRMGEMRIPHDIEKHVLWKSQQRTSCCLCLDAIPCYNSLVFLSCYFGLLASNLGFESPSGPNSLGVSPAAAFFFPFFSSGSDFSLPPACPIPASNFTQQCHNPWVLNCKVQGLSSLCNLVAFLLPSKGL